MADKKVTQLTELTTTNDEDQLLIVDDPNGTPASKRINVKNFFSTVPANNEESELGVPEVLFGL